MRYARQLREDKHLSLRDVEEQTKIDHSVISKFERGETGLTLDNLMILADFYGCTIDALVAEVEPARAQQEAS